MTTERDRRNQFQYELDQEVAKAEKRGKAEGIVEGREEGEKIGEARGKAEGREEGIEENRLATAKKMLAMNYPIEDISKITGLSIETLKNLK